MKIQHLISTGLILTLVGLSSVSCVSTRKVAYLQDMKHNTQIQLENDFQAVVSPYDQLDIIVTCFDSELAKPFNIYGAAQGSIGNSNANRDLAYLVDVDGNIEMPVLGTIHAAGLTRLQLQERIRNLLVSGGYIADPYVMVRFRDFKIFFLGSNGGKAITVPNERCTFLEALAMSGDLNVYTNRNKIAVMREVNGRMVMRYLDPRSSKVFHDPYFMLQQNDFIITRDSGYRNFMQSYSQWAPITSIISTIASFASIYLTFMVYQSTTK